jgi:hypothetical protein
LDRQTVAHTGRRGAALLARAVAALETRRRAAGRASPATTLLASRRAAFALTLRTSQLLAGRVYRRHLKLRLPRTAVKRGGLRQGGHTSFTRDALKAYTS